ncbi:hypothetical protein M3Y98_00592100 [Aphelenchoides besseyi]|nr:hypothetical protein M3Y98_00592100 [Aphelenchoides besseyi]
MSSIAQLPERLLSSLPKYSLASIGVGGLVEDANLRILLMKKRSDLYLDCNFPDTCDLYFVCYLKPDDKFEFETTLCSKLPSSGIRKFHHTILEPLMQ